MAERRATLADAARVASVNERTVLAWVERGLFRDGEVMRTFAKRGTGFAYSIDVVALLRVRREQQLPARVSEEELRQLLNSVQSTGFAGEGMHATLQSVASRVSSATTTRRRKVEVMDEAKIEPLPRGWMSVNGFGVMHGMQKNQRAMWQRAWTSKKLPVHIGAYQIGNQVSNYVLDADGMRAFGEIYHNASWWHDCDYPRCPYCTRPIAERTTEPPAMDDRINTDHERRSASSPFAMRREA